MTKSEMAMEIRKLRKQKMDLENRVSALVARQILDYRGIREIVDEKHDLATKLMTARSDEQKWIVNEISNMLCEIEYGGADYDKHTLEVLNHNVMNHIKV